METKITENEKQKKSTGFRVRTQVRVGGPKLSAKCEICKDNCVNEPDYYVCLSECELIC